MLTYTTETNYLVDIITIIGYMVPITKRTELKWNIYLHMTSTHLVWHLLTKRTHLNSNHSQNKSKIYTSASTRLKWAFQHTSHDVTTPLHEGLLAFKAPTQYWPLLQFLNGNFLPVDNLNFIMFRHSFEMITLQENYFH